jgi:adenosylcobinamide kinase/adenosylcobinamide-phosphate guanylyltransferase
MGRIVFISGGARSGKSTWAQRLAEGLPEERIYLATAPVVDAEMARRIARHQADRKAAGWKTLEETIDIAGLLARLPDRRTVLVDCLTLWINNLLYTSGQQGTEVSEGDISEECRHIVAACRRREGTPLFGYNEVGLGIVPDTSLGRVFRDLAGRCNQEMAAAADLVVFMVSGLPLYLKGESE